METREISIYDATMIELGYYDGVSTIGWDGDVLQHHQKHDDLTGADYWDNISQPIVLPALEIMGPGATLQDLM